MIAEVGRAGPVFSEQAPISWRTSLVLGHCRHH